MHRSGPVHPKHTLAAKLRQCNKQFWSARQAIAATEFALVLPILVILMLGSVEAARLIISAQRVTQVATTIVEMLSQTQARNPNETGTGIPWSITYIDLDFAIESTMVIFPQILQDAAQKGISWNNDISISMAGVLFTPNPKRARRTAATSPMSSGTAAPTSEPAGLLLPRFPTRRCRARRHFPLMFSRPVPRRGGRSSSSISSTTTRRFLDLASSEQFLSRVPPISRPAMCNPAPPPDISNITPRAATMA